METKILMQWTLAAALLFGNAGSSTAQDDWARWRGPQGNGIAADQDVPLTWSANENVVWKTKVPGRGHASPIVVGQRIFLATANLEEQTQSVLCYDRKSGESLWATEVNRGGFPEKIHAKNTHASPTVAIAGNYVVAVFHSHGEVAATALDFDGKQVWQKNLGPFESSYSFGFAPSPIVHEQMVIVTNENETDPAIRALDASTGEERWKIERIGINYSTPVVAEMDGRKELLISGCKGIASYNPDTGKKLWACPASWDVTCGTMVWDSELDMVFASGGYPTQQTIAVRADGSGSKVWEHPIKCYEQSLVVVDGYLYGQSDRGVIHCWNAADGKLQWRQRFESPESASPVVVGDHIFFTSEKGSTLVIKVNPKKYEKVALNRLGDESFASFAVCGNRIFTRVAMKDEATDSLQEWLYCLGKQ